MKYKLEDLKRELQKGDVILSHGDSWLSWLIREVSQSYWNHASMYIGDDKFIEADWNGVVIKDLEKLVSRNIGIFRHKDSEKINLEKIVKDVKNFEGYKYDYTQLIELGLMYAFGETIISKEVGAKNKFICSELCSYPYFMQSKNVIDDKYYTNVAPGDFAKSKYFNEIKF